ncbi:MAG: CPBP family intramembrane glutamic endopeptidase [Saprospiraceae bacterium]|nr:CPBP family intramembrane glutamic endopeptidase [Saprospiraceae bacterium]
MQSEKPDLLENEPSEDQLPFPFIILIILTLAVLIGSMLGSGLALAITSSRGVELQSLLNSVDESAPLSTRNLLRLINGINHLTTFILPSLAVAYLFFRHRWHQFLRISSTPGTRHVVLGILFMLAAFPLAQTTYWLNQQIPLPDWATAMESAAEGLLRGLLTMESPNELLFNLLIVAVLPAIGEELLFRGILQRRLETHLGNAAAAIWIAALIFSAFHLQFEGFLPRLVLGAVLGYLYVWTRNLWVPILAHFFSNGAQVVAQYVSGGALMEMELEPPQDPHWAAAFFSLIALLGIGYYLRKTREEIGT